MRDPNGISKGSGFVAYSTPEEASRAVSTCLLQLQKLHHIIFTAISIVAVVDTVLCVYEISSKNTFYLFLFFSFVFFSF